MASGEPERESSIAPQLAAARRRMMLWQTAYVVYQGAAYFAAGLALVSLLIVSRFVALTLTDWVWIMAAAMVVGVPSLWVGAGIMGWVVRPTRQQVDLLAVESRRIERDRSRQ